MSVVFFSDYVKNKTNRTKPAKTVRLPATCKLPKGFTVASHLGLSEEARITLISGDYSDEILDGDILTIEPTVKPTKGSIVVIKQKQRYIVRPFEKINDNHQIFGVVVAHTRKIKL